jgi:hypothetical protein
MRKPAIYLLLLLHVACKKDKSPAPAAETPNTSNATAAIDFSARNYDKPVLFKGQWYLNFNKDSFTVSNIDYYISNVKLTREDGTIFPEPESYHLIRHEDNKVSFTLNNIPNGTYKSLDFLVGIDEERNHSGAQTGDLDSEQGMFWEWNSGYIFFKMDGNFSSYANKIHQGYSVHIGGSEKYTCLQHCVISLQNPLIAGNATHSKIHMVTRVEELFMNPNKMDFDTYYANISLETFQKISDNYKDMFQVESVEN